MSAVGAGLALTLWSLPAAARPYLMLNADDRGFQALDLGDIDRARAGFVSVTLIDAPLAGTPVGNILAPLAERRIEINCGASWWRVLSTQYVDGQEKALGKTDVAADWAPFGDDALAPAIQAAACQRQYSQQLVSRYFNLGQILANFQSAHSKAAPEPQTEKDLLDRRYRNGR